jgi:hypothetical protein
MEGQKTDAPLRELALIYLWLARWEVGKERAMNGEGDLRLAEEYTKAVMGESEFKEV